MKKLILVILFLNIFIIINIFAELKTESVNMQNSSYITVDGKGNVKDFIIGKYEVSQEEYKTIMGNNPSKLKGDNLPVEKITWYDAVMYCNKLSEKEKILQYYSITNIEKDGNNIINAKVTKIGGQGYKLPTNEEWEYAAKGGVKTHGSASNDYAGSNNIDEVAWYTKNSETRTHPVGQKKPNELGIYDMAGNVWEWTETSKEENFKYFRGGSWHSNEYESGIKNLDYIYTEFMFNDLGFRVCRYVR